MRSSLLPFLLAIQALSAAPPILQQTFEDGESGWQILGKNGSVHVTQEPSDVRTGSSSLAFEYTVGEGFTMAVLPLAGKTVASMKKLRFWLKTDLPTGVAVLLNEKKPGGNYTAAFWSTGNTWQLVELAPGDFHLSEGPNDPKDPDDKLDLDQLEGLGLIDLSQLFNAARPNPDLGIAIDRRTGKHSLFIDDFELLSEGPAPPADMTLDDFHSPQLQWTTLGGAVLAPENRGMRILYREEEGNNPIFFRQLPRLDLRRGVSLAFDIASDQPAQLVLSLEERSPGKQQGSRHNVIIEVPGGGKIGHRAVLLSAFDTKPNLDNLKSFSIVDISAASSHETLKNSLWIGNIRAVTTEPQL
jgi:hypothetical protein